ncbi:synaptogyrin-2-like [Carassius carassius]|uniref:synaptogyrin-2-like n=1 Tax=Carassius carassius TaxID=217509 RepID=UPI002869173B|nr:synaptogyrin-2-like [Carassius carassius]
METSAYGASLAGGAFDFWSFVKRPQTIARLLSWLFAIVVFATIVSEGYINEPHLDTTKCMFNQNDSACSYGIGVGILAFLACVICTVLDAYFPQISNANERKYIVLGDLCFSGVWTFLWFVCFCVLANQWSHTTRIDVPSDAPRAVVTFSFFSIGTWGVLTAFALQRYRHGMDDVGLGYNDPSSIDHTSPYPSAYAGAPEGYQQSPFTASPAGQGGYQPPAY